MQLIPREDLIKILKDAFKVDLPEFRMFFYPMDRYVSDGVETVGILIQTTFLGEHIISHLRAPLVEEKMQVDSAYELAASVVSSFKTSIRSNAATKGYGNNPMGLSFGEALVAMRYGARVARDGWNGKDMLLMQVPGSKITVEKGRPLAACLPVGAEVDYLPHIDMLTADKKIVPWLASQTDIQAMDWRLV